jgi:hypothetical protein
MLVREVVIVPRTLVKETQERLAPWQREKLPVGNGTSITYKTKEGRSSLTGLT